MRPVLSPAEAAALDDAADVDVATLMERAGLALAIAATRRGVGYGDRVTMLAGPGNNGGDVYVMARHLRRRGVAVRVLAFAEPRTRAAVAAARAATFAGVRIDPWRDPVARDEVVVDGVFGVGFRGPLPDTVTNWAGAGSLRMAVDIPTGLSGLTGETLPLALPADLTVTFHAPKRGHLLGAGPEHTGVLEVVDIGLPDSTVDWFEADDTDAEPRQRPRQAHKWSVGGVAVVGGSPGMAGAPLLAAEAALAAGAGAALVVRPGGAAIPVPPPGLMGATIGDEPAFDTRHLAELSSLSKRWDVLVIGPGLGQGAGALVAGLAERWTGPMVIDADALVPELHDALTRRTYPTVLTPHAGEFARIAGREADPATAVELARTLGVVVLLKGSPTIVTDGNRTGLVTSGGPELATMGTGDVLAGMIGAALLGGDDPLAATVSAAHRHGRAGASLAAVTTVTADRLVASLGSLKDTSANERSGR